MVFSFIMEQPLFYAWNKNKHALFDGKFLLKFKMFLFSNISFQPRTSMYIRGFTKFDIKVLWRLQFSGVFEDLKFKISEGSDQNWSETSSIYIYSNLSNKPETS